MQRTYEARTRLKPFTERVSYISPDFRNAPLKRTLTAVRGADMAFGL